jgi:CBS domain-containing protein
MTGAEHLAEIAGQLREGRPTPSITVREFLNWFGVYRRGYWIVRDIREALKYAGLETNPDFESIYIDSPIEFTFAGQSLSGPELPQESERPKPEPPVAATENVAVATSPAYADPTSRISKLAAANRSVISVKLDSTLQEAITLMLSNDFSQLPVMTSDRVVKGVISWASIGSRLGLGKQGTLVRELMDEHHEIRADASLFSAIPIIVQNQYVLIRGADELITGIVTASDLSIQFQQLSEPFLLLGEIENHIRRLIGDHFEVAELAAARDPSDADRPIVRVADLSFGEYIRLLENGDRWNKLGLAADRKTFIAQLGAVRVIRNDVMHFDPDPLPDSDLDALRRFARFLQRLQALGAT